MSSTRRSAPEPGTPGAAWLAATGFVAILGQVVLLRELLVASFGSELIYLLAFGFWLLWTATGAVLGRRSFQPRAGHVRALLVAFAISLIASVVLARGLRILFGGVPGAYLPFPRQILALALVLLPVGCLLGLLFQWAAKLYVGDRRTLARAYAIESGGGLVGGLLATLLLRWGAQNLPAAWIAAIVAVVAAHPSGRRGPQRLRWANGALLFVLALGYYPAARILDPLLTRWNHPALVATRDTPYGRITVTEQEGRVTVFENDALAFESQGTAAEEFVHLAALQVARPREILILGGGIEGLVPEALSHRPARVDYVERNGALLDLAMAHMPDPIRASLRDPRVRVAVADPLRFLGGAGSYDLLLVGMPEPESGAANRFYTRDFFEECRAHLKPGGVLALRLGSAENLGTPALARRTASIHRALRAAFPDTLILPGATNIVLASASPLLRDPELLGARFRERTIPARLVSPDYIRCLLTNDRRVEIENRLERTPAPENSDARPICYSYTLLLWLARIELPASGGVPAAILGAILLPAFLLARRSPPLRRAVLVGTAGFLGMVLESALLLGYQVKRGVLYQDLGILLTLFLAGLTIGSLAIRRPGRTTGFEILGGAVALNLVAAWMLRAGLVAGLPTAGGLLLASGFVTGALFAFASLHGVESQRKAISPLYAADLIGGCAGSFLASLFLVPLVGLPGTALLLAGVSLLALLVL